MFNYKPWVDGFSVVTVIVERGPGIFILLIISYVCFIL
jgi:hypothetical protein